MKRTPLYHIQKELGGRFVPFAGYEMAVQFTGVINEHIAVRTHAGLFDVSHMGEVIVEGPQALEALQYLVTNDVRKLVPGKALYTVMCIDNGGIVDDLIIYCESANRYFLCVNASRRQDDVQHMQQTMAHFKCTVTDVSDHYAQLALQGPNASKILQMLSSVPEMPNNSFIDLSVANLENVRVSTTGYTGEPGYELYCANEQAEPLYRALIKAGEAFGLAPCGLGARDTLRLEMKYPLYGNDIDLDHNPIEAGLGWVVKFAKDNFKGKAALEASKNAGPTRRWVGIKMLDKGIARHGYAVQKEGVQIGIVTSGTHSPSLGEAIATCYVQKQFSEIGTQLHVMIRDKAMLAEVVETPFYKRTK